jgi:hypothetical protein
VEPTYEKKIETLDELVDSDFVFGYNQFLFYAKDTLSYPELLKFLDQKTQKDDCTGRYSCVERMIRERDMATSSATPYAAYLARKMGIVDVGKVICPLNEAAFSGSLIIIFKKGNPLLGRINILMRRYLEAGFLERHWAELQHRASLRGGGTFREATNEMFFAFSVSHLLPAFVVLLVGTVLSQAVFIGELIVNSLRRRIEKKNFRFRRLQKLR